MVQFVPFFIPPGRETDRLTRSKNKAFMTAFLFKAGPEIPPSNGIPGLALLVNKIT